jgi:hypothetical protein
MEEVRPENWGNLTIGLMINPRQGTGAEDDLLLADLMFTTPVGIHLIKQGKRAVSVGYDAHYEQIAPGMGRQKNIVCNHLALVDVARCGARCTIMDSGAALYTDTCEACDAAAFVESEHPREPDTGKFTEAGGGESGGEVAAAGGEAPVHTLSGAQAFIDKLSEQYPIAKRGGRFGTEGPHRVEVRHDDIQSDALGSHRGGHVYLSPAMWNEEFLTKHAKEWEGLVNDSSPEGILTHEFGHMLSHALEEAIDPVTVWNIVRQHLGVGANENMSIRNDQTSPYGQDNVFEFVAEAFTAFHNGKLSVGPGHEWADRLTKTQKGVWQELLNYAEGPALPQTPDAARYIATMYNMETNYSTERLQAAHDLIAGASKRGDTKHLTRLKRELAKRAKQARPVADDWTADIDYPEDPPFAAHVAHAEAAHERAQANYRAARAQPDSPVKIAQARRGLIHAATGHEVAAEAAAQIEGRAPGFADSCGCDRCAATRDIDWPATLDIDWADDWVEAEHPREAKGTEGGGRFTSGGGSTTVIHSTSAGTVIHQPSDYLRHMASLVPEPSKKWVGIRNSAKQMRAHVIKALTEGHSPESVIQRLKDIAHTEVHGSVAAYANELIKHVETAHELTAGMYGTAVARPELRKKREAQPEPAPPPLPDPAQRLRERVTGFAQMTPDAREAWVAKRASARQMKALVMRALENNEPPIDVVKQIQAMAGRELHGKVSVYANELIDYMAEAWQTDFSAYRAKPRKADTAAPAPTPAPTPSPAPPPPPPTPEPVKKQPQHISEVLKERGKYWGAKEHEFHAKAWEHASPQILAAMMTMRPLAGKGGGVDSPANKGCHYDPGDHHIQMGHDGLSTWRHEYGHAIDWNGTGWGLGPKREFNNQSYRADRDRGDEARKLVQAHRGGYTSKIDAYDWEAEAEKRGLSVAEINAFAGPKLTTKVAILDLLDGNLAAAEKVERGQSMQALTDGWREPGRHNSEYQDFIGSMTHEQIGNGHGKSYYTRMPAYKTAEMFAQYVALTNNQFGTLYRKMLHTIAPKCCQHFDDILAERAGLKDGPANPDSYETKLVNVAAPHMQKAAS